MILLLFSIFYRHWRFRAVREGIWAINPVKTTKKPLILCSKWTKSRKVSNKLGSVLPFCPGMRKVQKVVIFTVFNDFHKRFINPGCFLTPAVSKPRSKPQGDHFLPLLDTLWDTTFGTGKTSVFPIFDMSESTGTSLFGSPSRPITLKWSKMAKIMVFHENSRKSVEKCRKSGPKTVNSETKSVTLSPILRRFNFLLSQGFRTPGKSTISR